MPFKRKAESYSKSDPFVADDDDDDVSRENDNGFEPASKRNKKSSTTLSSSSSSSSSKHDEEGNEYWEISKARRVTISDFKGKKMVSIREYYEKDGKWLPGKKGITMTIEQYSTLLTILPQIDDRLSSAGERLPRPNYDGVGSRDTDKKNKKSSADHGDDDDDDDEEDRQGRKQNIDATSDEDED